MTTLFLVRHGRSTANTSGVLAGHTPGVVLDDIGVEQARALTSRFEGVRLAAIFTSPLERCRQTAAALTGLPDAPAVEADARFIECDYGQWTGRTLKDLETEPLWEDIRLRPSKVTFPGGESLAAFQSRVAQGVADLQAKVTTQHGEHAAWVVVSHADVIKAILADALALDFDKFQRILVDPASVSVIDHGHHFPAVAASNTTSGPLAPFAAGNHVVPGGGAGRQSA